VLGRDREGRQPEPRGLAEQLGREVLALVPLGRDRPQLARREVARELLQLPLLVGQLERDAAAGRELRQ
jgi:hypothetical protein